MELPDKVDYAMEAFSSLGMTREQAAGAIGALMGESGRSLNTSSFNPNDPGRGSFGIANWNGDRWSGLEDYAARNGKAVTDFKTQVGYVVNELTTSHKSALEAVKNTQTTAAASRAFTTHYEAPNPALAHYDNRAKNAEYVMSMVGGKTPTAANKAMSPLDYIGKALDIGTKAVTSANPVGTVAKEVGKAGLKEFDEFTDPITNGLKDMFGIGRDIKDEKTGAVTGHTQGTPVGNFIDGLFGETNLGAKAGALIGGIVGQAPGALIGGLVGQAAGQLLSGLFSNPNQKQTQTGIMATSPWAGYQAGLGFPDKPSAPETRAADTSQYSEAEMSAAQDWAGSHEAEMNSPGLY